MADGQRALAAAFPPPPPFWKHFTPENVEKLEHIKKESRSATNRADAAAKKWSPSELRALDVPPELRYLIPPEAPAEGSYSVFGELQSLSTNLPSLREQGIEQLYPDPPATDTDQNAGQPLNHAYYLLKISKSLLLNFLEFVGVLSVAPEEYESKLEDLRNLFINAHHLLNLYRPHQARESLILMMEEQLESRRNQIQEMDEVKTRVERLLEQLAADGLDAQQSLSQQSTDSAKSGQFDSKTVEEARQLWDLLKDES